MRNSKKQKLSRLIGNRQGGTVISTTMDPKQEVFVNKGQGLYAWTTLSLYEKFDLNDTANTGVIKFGQYGTNAEGGLVPQDTIKSYSGATIEQEVILWAVRFTDDEITNGTAYQTELLMQEHIGTRVADGSSTEGFNTSINKIKEVFSQVKYDSTSTECYSPRASQQEAIDKIEDYFENGGTEFLLGAIMRYGKNFTVLNVAKKILKPGDTMIVMTAKPGVFTSLENDIKSHVYFENFEYVNLKENKEFKPNPNKVNVIAVSSQLAMNVMSGDTVMETLSNTNIKLGFFDECHTGQDTDKFIEIEKELNIDHIIRGSGTPFKNLPRFEDKNSYFYGYVEQQVDKRKNLNNAVTLETHIIKQANYLSSDFYSEEEGHTLAKMFSTTADENDENPRFIHAGEVEKFVKDILDLSGNKKQYSPMKIQSGLDHTAWLLPHNSDAVQALKEMIESITDEYRVFAATANETKDIKDITDAIKNYKDGVEGSKKTITLTIGRFVEGTTVPEWTGAFVLSDTSSLEKYFQFIFRVCTPAEGKDKAYVFDFSKDRAFEMVYAFALATAENNDDEDIQEQVSQWLDNNNLFNHGSENVEMEQIKVGDILDMVKDSDYGTRALIRDHNKYTDNTLLLKNKDLLSSFIDSGNGKHAATSTVKFNVNADDDSKAKNKKTVNGRKLNKQEQSEMNKLIKNIVGVIAQLPYYFDMLGIENKTVEGIFELTDEQTKEFFNVAKQDLENLFNSGVISNKRFINMFM